MRLIDADRLIDALKCNYDMGDSKERLKVLPLLICIAKQPTAYDIDEVIKQIKNLKYEVNETYHIEEAIEIVRGGELNE